MVAAVASPTFNPSISTVRDGAEVCLAPIRDDRAQDHAVIVAEIGYGDRRSVQIDARIWRGSDLDPDAHIVQNGQRSGIVLRHGTGKTDGHMQHEFGLHRAEPSAKIGMAVSSAGSA
jgi:hypothetical protein